jgi:phosphate-selective porin OprO/OprP
MKGKSTLMAGVAAVALVASAQAGLAGKYTSSGTSAPVAAESSGPSNAELAARVQALEDAMQADETKVDADHSRLSALEQNFNYTTWTFDNGRPVVNSGDGRFSLAFRVRFQSDFAGFMQDAPSALPANAVKDLSSGAVIRRAYFGIEGKAYSDFVYEFRFNGGGSNGSPGAASVTGGEGDPLVNIARVAYVGIPHFRLNVGVIEPVFMFEGTTSSAQLIDIERPEIDNIAADSFGAGDSRRGIELTYQYDNAFMSGDNLVLSTAFTGAKTGTSSSSSGTGTGHGPGGDEPANWLGRASYRFWSDGPSNASIGASGATLLGGNSSVQFRDRPEIRVDGTRLIDTGSIAARHASMYAVDGGVNFNQFYLGGEYANFEVDRTVTSPTVGGGHPNFSGWYLEGSWVLTGEPKTYTVSATNNEVGGFGAPVPSAPFSFAGDSWGAWELTARYSDTNLDWNRTSSTPGPTLGIAGGEERIVDLGVNWYLNREVKLVVNDLIVNVNRLNAPGGTFANRMSQDLNIVGVRLQFSN